MTTTMLRKSLNADMTVSDGSREMLVKITSSAMDLDGEVLIPDGMRYANFLKKPTVFAEHEYGVRDVVGKVLALSRQGDGWLAKVFMFPKPQDHAGEWLPDTILHLSRHGVMGVSVGFRIIEDRKPSKKDFEQFGAEVNRVVNKWELLELSITPIPCNQDALVLAVSKGMKPAEAKRFWPNVVIPTPAKARPKVSLAAMVAEQWGRGAVKRAADDAVAMTLAKMRGRVYWP